MATEKDLEKIIESLKILEGRFINSQSLGLHLSSENEATFRRFAIEAKAILDVELGALNDFSSNLFPAINNYPGGYLGGPSLASVQSARALIEGGLNQIRRKSTHSGYASKIVGQSYIDTSRLSELRSLTSSAWDLTRLIRLAEELNVADANRCYMSIAMVARAISDHVPPIFSFKSFAEVANNYPGAASFRKSMANLNNSLRNIADSHLHVQIRQSEVLPTLQQVDFKADLDALLAEIVRVLKNSHK